MYHSPNQLPLCLHPAAGAAAQELKLWDQCGGEGGNCKTAGTCLNGPFPGKTCPSGSSCLKQSNWYFQCLPTEGYTCIPAAGNVPGAPAPSSAPSSRAALESIDGTAKPPP